MGLILHVSSFFGTYLLPGEALQHCILLVMVVPFQMRQYAFEAVGGIGRRWGTPISHPAAPRKAHLDLAALRWVVRGGKHFGYPRLMLQ